MSKGFFSVSKIQGRQRISNIPRCGSCGLYKYCKSPKMPPTGEGKKKILVVAEAPGANEDEHNTQLIGKAGKFLRSQLDYFNIDLDEDCWKTNAVICRREDNKTPEDYMIEACRPNLMNAIKKYKPNAILLLGGVACKSLLSEIWRDDIGALSRWGGWTIPCTKPNAWIIPTYHPSFLLRKNDEFLDRIFRSHLEAAIKKADAKPWDEIPDYKKEVEIITRPSEAARIIRDGLHRYSIAAFDYEANCLKPEGEGTKIVSCSICWDDIKTIAYPWDREAIDATSKFLKTSIKKIAANIKFEDRWTRVKLGHRVYSWFWDTVIAAHVLDNRSDITGLKFQAFVLLGAESYNEHIESFLKSKGSSKFNRIHEIDLKELLVYNGLDSLLAYKVAIKQMKLLRKRR